MRGGCLKLRLIATLVGALSLLSMVASAQDRVLVLGPQVPASKKLVEGLSDEVQGDFEISWRVMGKGVNPGDIKGAIEATQPRALVLIDNRIVAAYRRYQEVFPHSPRPPVMAVMTAFLSDSIAGITNASGIIYEMPAVTNFVSLRTLVEQPTERIGVIYRKGFEAYIEEQRQLVNREGFKIEAVKLGRKTSVSEVGRALDILLKKKQVHALWVLNDSVLLTRKLIVKAWLSRLMSSTVPAVVGVPSLVSTKFHFGVFGVVPDHYEMGVQAAGLLLDAMDNDWVLDSTGLSFPLSAKKILNLKYGRKLLQLKPGARAEVDEVRE